MSTPNISLYSLPNNSPQESLPPSFTPTIRLLNALTKPNLSLLLRFCFDRLARELQSEHDLLNLNESFDAFLRDNSEGKKQEMKDSGGVTPLLSSSEHLPLIKCLLFLFKSTIQHSLSQQQLESDLKQLGCNAGVASLVATAFFRHAREVILESMSGGGGSGTSTDASSDSFQINPVQDLEWRFGVTVSSSEMAKIGKPYVQMKFRVGGREEPVYLELGVEQFYEFLHEMEKAKALGDMMSI
mmetsp:Transcript_1068/g.3641  ORF Transcript_1068/g.3641 Transcript_1068/m.3641 type:complete len:242 (-) Transcript_1068:194-919(-)